MQFIQVDIATELSSGQLAKMREEIVEIVHEAIGSARAHINVAIREIPRDRLVEAGRTHDAQVAATAQP
jgi:phenylpyruvate tautomerase PptA (4-oxalocrotonate tautomerase family)